MISGREKSPSRECGGAFPVGFNKRLTQAGRERVCPIRTLLAELVEFSISSAAKKGMPFARGEPEHRAGGVLGITYADLAAGQAGYLDAVAVGKTQRTLDPGQTYARRPFRTAFEH